MEGTIGLSAIDWCIVGAYLVGSLAVGVLVTGKATANRESYFLAGRNLPWWWAGASIAATTFAADTPLAVTGIVASRGLSGNWMWLSWLGVHAIVVVYFARRWNRAATYTDAELVALRYSGRLVEPLRLARAGLYGVVYNCIILGWVLRAMVKIVSPFFRWEAWFPSAMGTFASHWPSGSTLGTASDAVTIMALLAVVAIYSSMGGIRGVILTDLVQLALALAGSVWFAWLAWAKVGGRRGLVDGLQNQFGTNHAKLDLFPWRDAGWLDALGMGAFAFGVYLLVQSYTNVPADGGGYLMQRLNTTKSPRDAQRASLLFLVLQYVIRVWPWFVVALAALVLIPVGEEASVFGGAAASVGADRELAYPVLMGVLLPPVGLGLVLASLLAAFMSTVDTHINWGASYVVNDVFLRMRPDASNASQIRVARLTVLCFAVLAVAVSFTIDTIEQAWQWVAALGASLGVPTALRWFWWRVNAAAEFGAMGFGLLAGIVAYVFLDLPYEYALITISSASLIGVLAGVAFGEPTSAETLRTFVEHVRPKGFWPGVSLGSSGSMLGGVALRWLSLVGGTVMLLVAGHAALLLGESLTALAYATVGAALVWASTHDRDFEGETA